MVASSDNHNLFLSRMVFLFVASSICFVSGCRETPREVAILIGGDTLGWITPCGCASNQSGGLARRAELLHRAGSPESTILLDVGGTAIGTGAYQRIKLESILNGLQQMGLRAHNIGQPETEFSPEELRHISGETGVRWIASNLRTGDGKPVGNASLSFVAAGLRILVAGVIDPDLVEHADWQPQEAVQGVLAAMDNQEADVRIVLAYFDEGGLRKLAESLPEVDYVIGGPTGQSMSPNMIGPVTVMSSTNKGKFLAELRIKKSEKSYEQISARIVEVESELKEDDAQLKNLSNYYNRLEARDFTAIEAGLVSFTDNQEHNYAIAGSSACRQCHQPDDAVWHSSKHAHSWDVLVMKHAQFDPHCQQCHTTGYGYQGGFQNVALSQKLAVVGCENCHGPSQAHVLDPRKRTPFQAREQCVRCHDHENSPEFEFATYWTKVFHSGVSTPPKLTEKTNAEAQL